jgi:hypothetical protein
MNDSILTQPGHVLLGARAAGYPGVDDTFAAGITDHERRIGRNVHLAMNFATPGRLPRPGRDGIQMLRRSGRALLQCWKPVERWAHADGNDYEINRYLMRCAVEVRALEVPVLMVLHHEPENDVGVVGSASEYRIMWAHVRRVFTDAGCKNVTWGAAFMNYPKWDSLLPQLWPVQADPEWILFNAYGSPARPGYVSNVDRFYQHLADESWFPSAEKLWGVREWSVKGLNGDAAYAYFNAARKSVEEGVFPRLRAHVVFDSPGKERISEMRVGYGSSGVPDAKKAAAYRAFSHAPAFGPITGTG